ncbi:P-loop NTPase fold protein [Rhodanobacter sp. T12-5]|uniref:P-loop NTPase fold protein n=1 Tax=Rhodanobacter sp. T12-5 TaxID=2024611 RepID=UPI0015621557|nr:P-loop NTPase fold protein [Rhodanobacter sp. T12-5]
MINKGTKQKLTQYLRAAAPSYAILLRGAWGSGKSFFWGGFKEGQLHKLRKNDITFSVAGLATLEELEQAMFLASVKDLGTDTLRETGTIVGRALLRLVKVDPDDIKLKAAVRSGKTVICIDDLERFGGDFKVLFGFIVSLLDAAKLHVVLISDEERAVKDLAGYQDYKEKIISVTAEVRPDIEAFYNDTVNGFEHKLTRETLLDIQDHAVAFFKEKRLKNLRSLRSILEEMKLIMEDMKWPEGQAASLGALLSAVTFHVMAVTKDVTNEALVREVFLHGDLGTTFMMSRVNQKKKAGSESEGESGAPLSKLVDDLGFESDIYEWHGSKAYAEYVTAEGFQPDQIAQDFQVFGHVKQEGASLLERFRSYRTMDETEFRACVTELEQKVAAGDFEHLQHMWEAYEILERLSQQKLITTSPEVWRDKFIQLAKNFKVTSDTPSSFEVWPEKRDGNHEAVLEALKALEQRIRVMKMKAENDAAQKVIIEGEDGPTIEGYRTPFVDAKATDIYARLRAAGRAGTDRMVQFFRKRLGISNLHDFATGEVPFAKALAKLIEARTPNTAPITLDDAAWLQLAAILRHFVTRLSPPKKAVTPPPSAQRGSAKGTATEGSA